MKKNKKILFSLLLVVLCFTLIGCDKGKVTAFLNISTETGAGEYAMDLFLRSDDDTNTQLANGIDGVMKSIQAYGEEKGIPFELATRHETVQKWDDNEEDTTPEDHEADVINVKFAFESLEDLNAKMVTLSNGGDIASSKGFVEFIPNPDGTTTVSYWNKAIEEVVLAMATHIHDDPTAYSGTEAPEGLVTTDFLNITVDDNTQEMILSAYSAFPNRHFEVTGTYVDASKIATPTPEPTIAPTEEPSDVTEDAAEDTSNDVAETTAASSETSDDSNNGTVIVIIIAAIAVVAFGIVLFLLQKRRKSSN